MISAQDIQDVLVGASVTDEDEFNSWATGNQSTASALKETLTQYKNELDAGKISEDEYRELIEGDSLVSDVCQKLQSQNKEIEVAALENIVKSLITLIPYPKLD